MVSIDSYLTISSNDYAFEAKPATDVVIVTSSQTQTKL